jgi:exonuclease III
MSRFLFFTFCLSVPFTISQSFNCAVPPSSSIDNRQSPNKWTLAQFNVEWLFTEPYSSCPGICSWKDTKDEYTHLDTIRNILSNLNADTVHMCEVQSCTQLDEVSPSPDYRSYMIKGDDTYTGQNVGLITKIDPVETLTRTEERVAYPIHNSKCGYIDEPGTEGVSKHLITRFIIQNVSIYLIGAHFLSDPNDPSSCAKREAQAQVLQYKIQQFISNGHEVIMMGDLNDFDGLYLDINNNKPNSLVLDTLKGNAGETNNYTLYTISAMIPQDTRYTEWYDENPDCKVETSEFSMIDHILVSHGLYTNIDYVEYYHNYNEGCGTYESDHFPILVTFRF